MEVIDLRNRPYSFKAENDPKALEYLGKLSKVYYALHNNGNICCRFVDGDRKGSIARLSLDPKYKNIQPPEIRKRGYYRADDFVLHNMYFYTICSWDGRRNKPKFQLPHKDVEILLDYDGPTIWEKFNAEEAKEEILKTPNQVDIDGNLLEIGDNVIYINARYGSSMQLQKGVIKEFKAVVDSKSETISTIIENEAGQISTLKYPGSMVYKGAI